MKDNPTITISDAAWSQAMKRVKILQEASAPEIMGYGRKVFIEVLPRGKQSYNSEEQIRLYSNLIEDQDPSLLYPSLLLSKIIEWPKLLAFHYSKKHHAVSIFLSVEKIEEIYGN